MAAFSGTLFVSSHFFVFVRERNQNNETDRFSASFSSFFFQVGPCLG